MTDAWAIRVEDVSKRYHIAHKSGSRSGGTYRRLSEEVVDWFRKPAGRLARRLKKGRCDAAVTNEKFWALRDVNFVVSPGEVVGIIGRNGAGKSTLLKLLSRISEPTSGRIEIDGRVASLLEVGTGFHPELTGRENIYLNGAILGMRRAEIRSKFDEIVDFAEVERFLDTPVKRYSSGMYVRLAFAVAAHIQPDILIVDEVLAVGDSAFQKKCLGRMQEVSREGRTVLLVSHNMAAIESMCTRCVLFERGQVALDGQPNAIINEYMRRANANASGCVVIDAHIGERFGPKEFATLKKIAICNSDAIQIQTVRMGELIYIKIYIDVKTVIDNVEIGIAISNIYGVYLHYLVSPWEGLSSIDKPGARLVEVEVPAVYLFPGTYFVSAWIKRQGAGYDDAVHDALSFDVQEAAVTQYATYFGRYSHNSQVYIPTKWRLVPIDH